jgi:hypothetical protein
MVKLKVLRSDGNRPDATMDIDNVVVHYNRTVGYTSPNRNGSSCCTKLVVTLETS